MIENPGLRKADSGYKGQEERNIPVVKMNTSENAVYYYLLSIANWNAAQKETHYYLLKKNVNKADIARRIGIGRTTVYNTFKSLLDKGVLRESDKYYYIDHPKLYAYIGQDVLDYLIDYFPITSSDIVKICVVVNHWIAINGKEGVSATDLADFCGRDKTHNSNILRVKIILKCLLDEGFINYYTTTEGYNGISYTMYHFTDVNIRSLPSSCSQEGIGGAPQEKIEKIKEELRENGII